MCLGQFKTIPITTKKYILNRFLNFAFVDAYFYFLLYHLIKVSKYFVDTTLLPPFYTPREQEIKVDTISIVLAVVTIH